jgi:hypothetical protein
MYSTNPLPSAYVLATSECASVIIACGVNAAVMIMNQGEINAIY